MRRTAGLAAVTAIFALAGCGESVQRLDASGKKRDSVPWVADDMASSRYYAPGWKGGDEWAWEAQIHERTRGQDEYGR